MAEIVLSIVSIFIAVISIIFVLWDHIFDDIVLSRRIQGYYNEIERLIHSYYFKIGYHQIFDDMRAKIGKGAITTHDEAKKLKEKYSKYNLMNWYAKDSVALGFGEFSKYLGLVRYRDNQYYFTHTMKLLEQFGSLGELYDDLFKDIHISHRPLFSYRDLRNEGKINEVVKQINDFLKDIRDFWYLTFKKNKIFRKKIKPKLNFKDLEKVFTKE